jgi:MFS family permease
MLSEYVRIARNRNFSLIWLGQTISQFGDALYDIALIWLALQMSEQSSFSVGLILLARLLPYLLFGLVASAYSDRWNRKWTMFWCDFLRGCIVLLVPILYLFGVLSLWHLAIVAFALTTLRTLFQPTLQAAVPQVVPPDSLVSGNGLLQASFQTAAVLGPVVAGGLLLLVPPVTLFSFDSMTFVAGALAVLPVRLAPRAGESETRRTNVFGEIAVALRAIRARPIVLLAMVLSGAVLLALAGIYRVGMPIFTDNVLHGGAPEYGLLMGAMGLGTVLGALAVGWLGHRQQAMLIFLGWAAWGACFAMMGLSSELVVAAGLALLGGTAESITGVLMTSLIQREMPADQLGRAFGVWMLQGAVGDATSGVMVGFLLSKFAVAPVFVACGLTAVGVGVVGLALLASMQRVASRLELSASVQHPGQ